NGALTKSRVAVNSLGGCHGFQDQSSSSEDAGSEKDGGLVCQVCRSEDRVRAHGAQRPRKLSAQLARRGSQRDRIFRRAEVGTILRSRTHSHRHRRLCRRSRKDQGCRHQNTRGAGTSRWSEGLFFRRAGRRAAGVFGNEVKLIGLMEQGSIGLTHSSNTPFFLVTSRAAPFPTVRFHGRAPANLCTL